ncbi:MAG: hypothetical protein F6K00_31740 [Leptolyngbya sp. SIOISBB]|nr:hypothetical protein [Leptolyngbya sp. SIOISBB]
MLSPTVLNPQPTQMEPSLQPVKLLSQRDDYTTCHIFVPEVGAPDGGHRSPAIALDGLFYSFFHSSVKPVKILRLLQKLSAKGELTVTTPTSHGYAIWVHEPEAELATRKGKQSRTLPPSFGPANCWLIGDRQPNYRPCTLDVPDLPDTVQGLANGQKLFSLFRRESDADMALKLGSRLSQRGDETVILVSEDAYAICIYEPGATIAA